MGAESVIADGLRRCWLGASPFVRAQIAVWGLFAIIDVVNKGLTYEDLLAALTLSAATMALLLALSTIFSRIYSRDSFTGGLTLATIMRIAMLSGGGGALVVAVVATIRTLTGWDMPDWQPVEAVFIPLIYYSLVLTGWSCGFLWLRAEVATQAQRRRAAAAEAEALRAELQQLRLQLDPHFLFNALNGAIEEVHEDPMAAAAMLTEIAAYLRHSLDTIDAPVSTVGAEAAALDAYLRIQKTRFGPRLISRITLGAGAAERSIAAFLLQPLVENAFKHGSRRPDLRVEIDIRRRDDALHVQIVSTGGLAAPAHARPSSGLGLANLRQRLAVHYPGRHSFALREGERRPAPDSRPSVTAELVLEGEPCSGS